MPTLNNVTLIGNLTADPELKHTTGGTAVSQISLALNHAYKDGQGNKVEKTSFVDVKLWGRSAEIVREYCRKGRALAVIGRLEQETWDDKTTGQKRSRLVVVAERVTLLSGGTKKEDTPAAPSPDPDAPQPDDIPF